MSTFSPSPDGSIDAARLATLVTDMHELLLPCFKLHAGALLSWFEKTSSSTKDDACLTEGVLSRCTLADLNEPATHLMFPYALEGGISGRALSDFWPRESRSDLADAIMAVVLGNCHPAVERRAVSSLVLDHPTLTVISGPAGSKFIFLTVTGGLRENRTFYDLWTSEARFRQLIHYLPVALLQVDTTAMEPIWRRLRAEKVADLSVYLDKNPEMVEFSCKSVRVTSANRAAAHLLGLPEQTAHMSSSVEFLFAHAKDTAQRVMTAHYMGARNLVETMPLQKFDGEMRKVQMSVTYPNAPEQLDITLIALEDVTERLQIQRQLQQLQADFTHAARITTLGELATSIAHEVTQPLAAIVTNADASLRWMQQQNPKMEKVRQLNTRIAVNARRASDIIQRVRDMARNRMPQFDAVDVSDVVREALLFVQHDMTTRGVKLCAMLSYDEIFVTGDRVQLHQVIVNLVVNAAQAFEQRQSDAVCHVTIETMVERGHALVRVSDEGPGISQDHLPHIFDGFFTTKASGLGMGLAICHSIIAAHGGQITAQNRNPHGAVFTVALPLGSDL
jgi:two-component system, LuxR family, sensor kinase FixL